ncbi:MAG: hypothetical protein QME96_06835 [Myxococcota bacterium]|nr:hypothetical protein [Myxococcota bacterium]
MDPQYAKRQMQAWDAALSERIGPLPTEERSKMLQVGEETARRVTAGLLAVSSGRALDAAWEAIGVVSGLDPILAQDLAGRAAVFEALSRDQEVVDPLVATAVATGGPAAAGWLTVGADAGRGHVLVQEVRDVEKAIDMLLRRAKRTVRRDVRRRLAKQGDDEEMRAEARQIVERFLAALAAALLRQRSGT